ncbi:hypothetical protein MD588_08430 [Photobacterium sp. SDRW27]|uniref:SH3 domain-containing protein n=1 Tax=Photobacterium obscurum TaxID=2829490 RepID=UPI0022447D2F|nr:SH3 domain-containing protein [Photobacterium obscurum]MCW8328834.1 hypothetical protein [Photobacterium obscurum]
MRYKVVKEYSDAPSNPIKVKKGEILQFIEESNPEGDWANWIFCKGKNKEGWVPKQILEIKDNHVTTLEDYHAIEHSLSVGEFLVAKSALNGWIWSAKCDTPEEFAWAPLNHLAKE